MRFIIAVVSLIGVAACSGGGGDNQNLASASGNSLTPAQIDAALGPANRQSTINEAAPVSAERNDERNAGEAGLLRRHSAGNAAE